MRVYYGFDDVAINGAVCTVGSYDGVHVGHRVLIRECVTRAHEMEGESVVLTFEPHPRIVLGKSEGLKLLTTLPEKIELLRAEGVDNLIVIPFDRAFSQLRYSDFIKRYLLDRVNMKCMVVGYNHLFGRNNEGNYAVLTELSESCGFDIVRVAEQRNLESKVSSTVIRALIAEGDIERANQLLGRPYLIYNSIEPLKLLPPSGVYATSIDGAAAEVEFSQSGVIQRDNRPIGTKIEIYKKL